MPKITVVDPHHWIDPDLGFPESGPVRAKAVRVAQCIEYGGTLPRHEGRNTLIACRFRPGGAPCPGFLIVIKQPDDTILAMCDWCEEEEFLIHNWQDTSFAQGQPEGVRLDLLEDELSEGSCFSPRHPSSDAGDIDERLAAALKAMGWNIPTAELRQVISTSEMPSDVLRHLQTRLPPPPNAQAFVQFMPMLMEAWNDTARPDLDGLSPQEKAKQRPASAPEGPARNAPCPCGSGKKYKRCCISERLKN